ncbi:MAG: CocE/NonD family hydrolase [Solirubrobacteraceae bacterium]
MLLLPALLVALHAPAALADPAVVTPPYDPTWYKAAGGDWTQATIASADGTKLHADILRPAGAKASDKTPVILSIGPYFNHSGQTGPAGPAENSSYTPIGTEGVGPSDRFADFVAGSGLLKKGYSFVMVDLRGFGGSEGCLDWAGAGEQGDVKAAVEWAAKQPWSTGLVGTYGKSYDALTGLIAATLHPNGLGAVVSQEPVYDDYRYLYGDGMRRENSLATPALYDAIASTPGPLADDPAYNQASLNTPDCTGQNYLAQAGDDNHASDFWKQRNFIEKIKGSAVPIFFTQGLTENNTAPDGLAEFLGNHAGFQRAWFGPWEHVRGNETCADGDGSTGCSDFPVGRLKMGRRGWFDEVLRFYDLFLKNQEPSVQDPPIAVQTNDGKWRGEASWPPADAAAFTTKLRAGTYTDLAQSSGYGDNGAPGAQPGAWTISKVLPYEVDLAGAPVATVDVTTVAPNANLVVDVYDLNSKGVGPLVSRQGFLVRSPGAKQKITLRMMSADWRFVAGHRIGVRVTDNNQEWWIAAQPSGQTVVVNGGTIALPFLKFARPTTIEGDSGVQLKSYLAETEDAGDQLATSVSSAFVVPPALAQPSPGDPGTPEAIAAAQRHAKVLAGSSVTSGASYTASGAPATAGSSGTSKLKRITVGIGRVKHARHAFRASGKAPAGARVLVRLIRNLKPVAKHWVRANAKGRFTTVFKNVAKGRYHVRAYLKLDGQKYHARSGRWLRIR